MNNINLEDKLIKMITENKENFYRLAYSYVKNADDALDIVQESNQKALTNIRGIKNEQHMKTWYYRIVVNTSLDFLRKQKKIIVVDDATLEFYGNGNDDFYHDIDLERSLNSLPPMYRTVIILRYFEDLKIEEVAEILKENQNTIKTRIYKALSMLRIQIDGQKEDSI